VKIPNEIPLRHPDASHVIGVAFSAAKIIEKIYAGDFATEFKDGEEPVTAADRQSDLHIISELRSRHPHDRILSEEHGLNEPPAFNNRVWFIDPIDGTSEFIKRSGEFAIQIGLAVGGSLDFGLVYQPIGRNLYVAARGEGCWWYNPASGWQRLQISPRGSNLRLAVSRSHPCPLGRSVHEKLSGTGVFACGGVGLKLMAMARGLADYYINSSNKTKAWDIAAPEILFVEAGGQVSDLAGGAFSYDPADFRHRNGLLAACDRTLQQQVVSLAGPLKIQA
jgi:3'(2'), 5'-bisphosphate nucleotidase